MDSAVLRIILDSSVVIEAERQQLNVAQFLTQIAQKIGEHEAAFLDDLKAAVPVYPITDNTAELAGKIGGESSGKGVTFLWMTY